MVPMELHHRVDELILAEASSHSPVVPEAGRCVARGWHRYDVLGGTAARLHAANLQVMREQRGRSDFLDEGMGGSSGST